MDLSLTSLLSGLGRRVGALEDEQSTPDVISQIVKSYGNLLVVATIRVSRHAFPVCSGSLMCSEELIV